MCLFDCCKKLFDNSSSSSSSYPYDPCLDACLRPTHSPSQTTIPQTILMPRTVEISSMRSSAPINYNQPECVICLEEFTEVCSSLFVFYPILFLSLYQNDPIIPTLCSCGENKALFHLPCLLHYRNRYNYCPVCKGNLYFQVFDLFCLLLTTTLFRRHREAASKLHLRKEPQLKSVELIFQNHRCELFK